MKIRHKSMKLVALAVLTATLSLWYAGPAAAAESTGKQQAEKSQDQALPQTAFTYQGQLKGESTPVTGDYDFQFTLFTGQTGGEQRGLTISQRVNLANGFFKVQLDFGNASGGGKESWLGIALRPADTTEEYTVLSPRHRLTSTPYAILAQQGPWSLIGIPIGFVDNASLATVSDPLQEGAARPAETIAKAEPDQEKTPSPGSAIPNGPGEAAGWTDDGAVVRLTTGTNRVGIGTPNPNSKFHVITPANEGAGRFEINNAGNSFSALFTSTNGNGSALWAQTAGTGRAAFFKSTNPGIDSTTVAVDTLHGFGISSYSNDGTAMHGSTSSATKPAGQFSILNPNSSAVALRGETEGTGTGVYGEGRTGVFGKGTSSGVGGTSLDGIGVSGSSVNSTGVLGTSFHGTAGKFVNGNLGSNTNPALEAISYDRGPAGRFEAKFGPVLVVEGEADGISAKTTGIGFAGAFENTNSRDDNQSGALFAHSTGRNSITARFHNSAGGYAIWAGKTKVTVLEISGGADLAEKFEVSEAARPGMVVAIDPRRPGSLCVARGAYNRRVAGVISGANNLDAGMILADLPGVKDSLPLALSGRVWVNADATSRAIAPGDLLTTAVRPGHAMKVANHARAQGAIIGKAITGLKKGQTGMVLVLINLQ